MFSSYLHVVGAYMPVLSDFEQMAEDAIREFDVPKSSLVIDIGANDGSLLTKFRDLGMKILMEDPEERTEKLANEINDS